MKLPELLNDNELFMWERILFFGLIIASFFNKYQKFLLLVALVSFLVIYSLYFYNFLRHSWETDCKMLQATSEAVETIYLSNAQRFVLRGQYMKPEEEKRFLAYKFEDQANRLCEERQKVSELSEKCATLEEEKGNSGKELGDEREVKELSITGFTAGERLKEKTEILKKDLSEIHVKSDEEVKKLEDENKKLREVKNVLGKKMLFLQKKFKKLKEEKRVWDAERENLLIVVDSQASVIEAYKDMMNKEECLMKLFPISW